MLKINNLTKSYDKFKLDCSLEIEEGSITGIIGRNGAGKSTLFKSILGVTNRDSGSIEIFGKSIDNFTVEDKSMIGTSFPDSGFPSIFTIKDIITVMENMYATFNKEWFVTKLNLYELPTKKKLADFSTGMSARLKILLALSFDTKFLILDEPTAGLDVVARDEILDMLREYMEEDSNRSILISSHIASDLSNLCDDIYMIDGGKIVFHDESDNIANEYGVIKLDEDDYDRLDKEYIISTCRENDIIKGITNQRKFYEENYPDIVIERASIDDVIFIMSKPNV